MEPQLDINVMPAMSWEEAATCISGGTVESLSGLRRSEEGLKSYREFKEQASKPQHTVIPLRQISRMPQAALPPTSAYLLPGPELHDA